MRAFVFFLFLLAFSFASDVSLVTVSRISSAADMDRMLLFVRFFWQFNADTNTAAALHVCHSPDISSTDLDELSKLHVKLEKENWIPADPDVGKAELLCLGRVAAKYTKAEKTRVAFVPFSFLVFKPLGVLLDAPLPANGVRCIAETHRHSRQDSGALCELPFLTLSSRIGPEFYAVLNSSLSLPVSGAVLVNVAVRSLEMQLSFWPPQDLLIVRAARVWSLRAPVGSDGLVVEEPVKEVMAIEFDGKEHQLAVRDCLFHVTVAWPMPYNTVDVISATLEQIDEDTIRILAGCDDSVLFRRLQSIDNNFNWKDQTAWYVPRVFDSVLFNDEIDLLKLRLAYLRDHVTKHILVEAATTFTGKPKPLYFDQFKHVFSEQELSRIHRVVVKELPHPNPETNGQVWRNEYFSRNQVAGALQDLNASDWDLVVLADVDEIPHVDALETMRSLYSVYRSASQESSSSSAVHTTRPRIHRLYQETFMYNFECFMHNEVPLVGGATVVTTIGVAKANGLNYVQSMDSDNFISLARSHLQTTGTPFPYDAVLTPGGWHLTFFGGVQRIQRKLSSYSHQNFAKLLSSDDGAPLLEKIEETVAAGKDIDFRSDRRCSSVSLREEAARIRDLLSEIQGKLSQDLESLSRSE